MIKRSVNAMFDWIRNPFECQLTDLIGREQELAELLSDRTSYLQFNRMSLLSFWIACSQEYINHCPTKPSMFSYQFLPPTCAKQHFLQSLRWKPNTDRDWMLKMTYECVCQTYHRVWTNSAVNNRHTLHIEHSATWKRLVIIGDWSK